MKLCLKNIGKIEEATVEINGITVIAGENNTGKSTIGKALYSIFNSFYVTEKQIRLERVESIEDLLDIMYRDVTNRFTSRVDTREIAEELVEYSVNNPYDAEVLEKEIFDAICQYDENFEKFSGNNMIQGASQRILEVLQVSNDEVFKTVLNKKLDLEFNGQINNIFSEQDGQIDLQIKEQLISIEISANLVTNIKNRIDLNTEAVYLDDPFVLDAQNRIRFHSSYYPDHKAHLKSKLFTLSNDRNIVNEIVTANKLEKIYQKINTICNGNIVKKGRGDWGYQRANTDKILDIKNISAGLKTFVILKRLLENGIIETNGTIILDEPEIHLHPEWQLLFAELIVLIQKEFHMHILLNTHSPYFLRAIQVYSAKYEIADQCKYYLSALKDDKAIISDVTSEIEKIYKKLSYPLQQLEDERWRDD